MKLPVEFYTREDVLQISRELLGKYLYTYVDDTLCGGMITETEAYRAPEDKASHAYGGRRTARTETFFEEGGVSYVYLCYGIHHLFNIVTNRRDVPHAVLIRAIEPVEGIDKMLERRKKNKVVPALTAGPGALSQALGIRHREHNNLSLQGDCIWIEDRGIRLEDKQIVAGPRIGIAYAKEYAAKPWRYGIRGSVWLSKPF
jgi:DNA-3-methyladenine glycosylase